MNAATRVAFVLVILTSLLLQWRAYHTGINHGKRFVCEVSG